MFKSIRWRLQIWHGLILVTVLAGFGVTAYQLTRVNELRRVDQELQQRSSALGAAGLGLAICKAIVDAHGGTLEINSELGKGSSFTLKLPAK